jgi:prevent-host-death family protein
MKSWPVQDAKARFSELLKARLTEGPQIVTLRGVEAAVLVPIQEWRRLRERARPTNCAQVGLKAQAPSARAAVSAHPLEARSEV